MEDVAGKSNIETARQSRGSRTWTNVQIVQLPIARPVLNAEKYPKRARTDLTKETGRGTFNYEHKFTKKLHFDLI